MRRGLLFFFIIFCCVRSSVLGQSYGSSSANLPMGEHVSQVLFGTQVSWGENDILNPSATTFSSNCAKYSDFTIGNTNPTDGNLSNSVYVASVQKGLSYDFLLQSDACGVANGQKQVKVYIDYNDDGDFVDLGEDVWTSATTGLASSLFSTTITIPLTASSGELRMRVIYYRISGPPVSSVGNYLFGETEDYSIVVTSYIDSIAIGNSQCYGDSTGSITIAPDVTAPVGVVYSINGLAGPWSENTSYTNLPAGDYDVWAKEQPDPADPGSASYEQYEITIEEPDSITFDAFVSSDYNGANISCYGNTDGEITIDNEAGGWVAGYSYGVVNQSGDTITSATSPIQNLAADTFSIFVVNDDDCFSNMEIIIIEPDSIKFITTMISDYNGEEVSCVGACDGEMDILASGGTPTYNYLINGLDTGSAFVAGFCAGVYEISVVDTNDCIFSDSVTILDPVPIEVIAAVTTNAYGYEVSCNGGSDGELIITPSGGVGNFTFSVDSGQTFSDLDTVNGLIADTYDVMVADDNGCLSNVVLTTISEPDALDFDLVSILPISCNGVSDGEITLSATGGVPGYEYSITGGAPYQSGTTFQELGAGNYVIAVIDTIGCEYTEVFELTEPDPLQFSAAIISDYNGEDVSCYQGNDGELLLTVTGGSEPYVYDLFGGLPANPLLTSGLVSNLTSGTYTIMLSDDNDCPSGPESIEVILDQPDQLEITGVQVLSDISCYGETDGSLQISATGGTGNYTYIAGGNYPSGSQSTFTINNLAGGNYNVSVLDDNGCVSSPYNVLIDEPAELVVTVIPTNLGCNGDDSGSASLNLTGGVPNFDYLWSDGQTTATATGLSAGSYSVEVTDGNNCTGSADFTITQPVLITQTVEVNCFGASDGEIMVSIQDPNLSSVYSYSWNDPSFQTTALAVNLMAGTYTVYVSDQFGCVLTATDSIIQPDSLAVMVEHTNLCQDSPWAEAIVYASGGVEPYDYLWSTAEQTTQITIVNDGSYSVDVIDGNNCISVFDFIIDPMLPINIDFTVVDATCKDNVDGVIIPEITGGYPPFEFLWSNYATTAINADVAAGIYSVDITDSHGCSHTGSAFVDADPSACLEVYSAFTPNGDENNDYWHIGQIELYPDAHVEVFNRWGERVFAGKNYTNTWEGGWTGMYNGKLLPSATYYYVITLNNEEEPYRGTVTIVR